LNCHAVPRDMVRAFIFVQTGAGESEELLRPIGEFEDVVEAHIVAGEWDVIAEVETGEVYEVMKASSSGIQALDGVTDTKTYIVIDE